MRGVAFVTGVSCASLAVLLAAPDAFGAKKKGKLPDSLVDTDFLADGVPSADLVELGRLLFFDKELSGNRNISCATCHHPLVAVGDGLSLSVGEGGQGLGTTRNLGVGGDAVVERVPRNAPHLFNIGAREFTFMFHDGRVSENPAAPSGFDSPAGVDLPTGLDSIVAVQAMFPVTSATEMAGQDGENDVADAAADGDLPGVWGLLAERLQSIPGYVTLFVAAFDDVDQATDITMVHAANAIAAYENVVFRADGSAFDRYLRGDHRSLSARAHRGMKAFYGKAGCSDCHSGVLQTDHDFHSIAAPQIGPGKGDGLNGREDFGRERVTHDAADRFRFRTPSLRQVAQTAPYGHAGAYDSLEDMVRHHFAPAASLDAYSLDKATLPSRPDLDALDDDVMSNPTLVAAIAASSEIEDGSVSDRDVEDLLAFLHALTDESRIDLRKDVPESVPSGLPIYE